MVRLGGSTSVHPHVGRLDPQRAVIFAIECDVLLQFKTAGLVKHRCVEQHEAATLQLVLVGDSLLVDRCKKGKRANSNSKNYGGSRIQTDVFRSPAQNFPISMRVTSITFA